MNLKVGIAGYGVVGKRREQCIQRHLNMEVVAVCDRNFKDSGTFENGVKYFQNYKDLLKLDLDVLIVCMTNDIAPEVTIAGLNKKLHVFCEKPPGRTVEDIMKVIDCERKHGDLKLMYGFNHRYHESVQDALKLIKSGEFGKIVNMKGVYGKSQLITFNQSDWRTTREIAGGGVLLDQGIHMVDLMRLFADQEFTDVHSFISNSYWGYNVEDNAYALMKTDGGIVALLNSSATQWRHRFNLDIALERGTIVLGGILSSSKSYGAEKMIVIWANPIHDNGDPKEQITRYNIDPSWDKELDSFYEWIVNDTPISHGTSNDALSTMKLVYKIYYADEKWRKEYNITSPD